MPVLADEETRSQVLADYAVLDSEPEECFDTIVDFARTLCDAPIALIAFVGRDRQWYKACRWARCA